jgi:elongator complex protein 1
VWDMHTRLGLGRGKVFDQVKMWSGFVAEDNKTTEWRQIALKSCLDNMRSITVLGSWLGQDVVGRVKFEGESAFRQVFELKKRSMRILDDVGGYFQAPEGEIYQCRCIIPYFSSL